MRFDAAQREAVERTAGPVGRGRALIKRIAANDVLLASLALGILIIIFFFDIVFLGRTLVTSSFQPGVLAGSPPFGYPGHPPDYNFYIKDPLASAAGSEPKFETAAARFRDFRVPLWDPHQALGRPLLASEAPEVASPIRLPLLVMPSPEMWDAVLIAPFFVAGLFTYLLAKRLGLVRLAAFGAATAFSFSGFFMIFVNTPHPDYAMMIPVVLYAFELLLERPTPGRMAFAAVAVALGVLADNPETAVVLLLFGGAYYLARAISRASSEADFHFWPRTLPVALAMTAGVGLTAFAYFPFLELAGYLGFSSLSVHRHGADAGLGLLAQHAHSLISLFVPWFNGPTNSNFQGTGSNGIRDYVGVVVPTLAFIGLWNRAHMGKSGWFFLGSAVLLLAKTYGVPAVNWVGRLPVLNAIIFPQYLAPAIGFSLAMLAGLGLDQISRRGWRRWHLALGMIVIASLLGWLVWLNRYLLDSIPKSHLLFYMAVGVGLAAVGAAVAMSTRRNWLSVRVALIVLIALVTTELYIPTLPVKGDLGAITRESYGRYLPVIERPRRYDPFTEPPYVEFLKEDASEYRVFGLEYVLYPNASMVYGIDDIRGYTALTVDRYFEFIKTFINPSTRQRFTGAPLPPLHSEFEPAKYVANPMFDLLNVKYILTPQGLPELYDHSLADALMSHTANTSQVRLQLYRIDGQEEAVLFQHPPSSLSYDLTPSEDSRFLTFRLALDPVVWAPDFGDGVLFQVSVVDGGTEETVFSRWVDPKNDPADRRWIDSAVDLSPYLDRPVTLVLSTLPGESSNWDWAGWGALRLADSPRSALPNLSPGQFQLVYDDEVEIYLNRHAFPRAFVVYKAEIVPGMDEAIDRMKEEEFDPSQVAVIEADRPPPELVALEEEKATTGSSVEITEYGDNRVKLTVETESAGLLVLSDTYYPGWKAYVDGKRTPIYATDLAFRSVYLEPGEHEVKFVYSPRSFKMGVLISGLSLLALGAYASWGTARSLLVRLGL
jgi:hypothetical protein